MKWISVKDQLPPEETTVWVYNETSGFVGLGDYTYIANEGWFWCVSTNPLIYAENNKIIAETELDDDYEITHWHAIPELPQAKINHTKFDVK